MCRACQQAIPRERLGFGAGVNARMSVTLCTPVSKIRNERSDSNTTYCTAITAKGAYECEVASGALVAVDGMGLFTSSPTCWKQGQAPMLRWSLGSAGQVTASEGVGTLDGVV